MGNIGEPMTSTIPAVGSSGTAYATSINAFLAEVEQRLEAPVPLDSLLIGDLDMANNDIENVRSLYFYPATDSPTEVGTIQMFAGDFWFVSPSGAVRITTGATLNSAGIGGITGDYGGANPAQLRFVDADSEYYFYDDFSTSTWAFTRARGVDIAGGATSAVRVRLLWGGVSSYSLTLPAAPPAAAAFLQMDTAGAVTASSTITTAVTALKFLYTDAQLITFGGGAGVTANSGTTPTYDPATNQWTHGTSVIRIVFDLPLIVGDRLKSWFINLSKGSASGSVSAQLFEYTISTGARLQIGLTQSNSANNPGNIALGTSSGLDITVAAGKSYFVAVAPSGVAGDVTLGGTISRDRPV